MEAGTEYIYETLKQGDNTWLIRRMESDGASVTDAEHRRDQFTSVKSPKTLRA